MFSAMINKNPFISKEGNIYFSHFVETEYESRALIDMSFVSTLRALLGSRVSNNEKFEINVSRESRVISSDIDDQGILEHLKGVGDFRDGIYLLFVSVDEVGRERVMNLAGTSLLEVLPNYQKVNRITEFFKQYFNVHCFINPEKKHSYIIADDKDSVRLHHYLQSAIPPAFPWFFENNPLTEDELKLIRSLRESKSDDYLSTLDVLQSNLISGLAMLKKC